jgi:hypothetical protein
VKRVKVEAQTYKHTEKGKLKVSRGYALIDEGGEPIFVGLFASEEKAEGFCRERGWRLVK